MRLSEMVVFDPLIPESDRSRLAKALHSGTAPCAGRRLGPDDLSRLGMLLLAVLAEQLLLRVMPGTSHNLVLLALVATFAVTIFAVARTAVPAAVAASAERTRARLLAAYDGRYIIPLRELDAEAGRLWDRAVGAEATVTQSAAFRLRLIDSDLVTADMPGRLWGIAQMLAGVSRARAGDQEILRGVDPRHPGVAAQLAPQRQIQSLVLADAEQRVRSLEELADAARTVDDALRRRKAVQRLTERNADHLDLLSLLGGSDSDAELTKWAVSDAQAAADQVDEAVRRANEAARRLRVPDRDRSAPASRA